VAIPRIETEKACGPTGRGIKDESRGDLTSSIDVMVLGVAANHGGTRHYFLVLNAKIS
jgi:hypothetical protein